MSAEQILCDICDQCDALAALLNHTNTTNMTGGSQAETVSAGLQAMATTLTSVASFFSCFGVNLQKWAHNVEQKKPAAERKPLLKCWRWWLGIITMVCASGGDIAALPFIPLSRVAALGSLAIVANVFICPLFLGEKITRNDTLGAALTVAGTFIACMFGVSEEPEIDSECMLHLFGAKLFIAYFIVNIGVLMVLFYFMEGFRRTKERLVALQLSEPGQPPITSFECLTVWASPSVLKQLTPVIDDRFIFITRFGPQFYPGIIALFAGISGAQSVTLSKTVLVFLRNAAQGDEVGRSVGFMFVFLLPMGLFLYGQIRFLNEALSIYRDSLFVLPVYQCTWILMGIASGLIFYQEYRDLKALNAVLFSLGVLMSLAGVQVLTSRKAAGIRSRQGSVATTPTAMHRTGSICTASVAPADESDFYGIQYTQEIGEDDVSSKPSPAVGSKLGRQPSRAGRSRGASMTVWPPPERSEQQHVPSVAVSVGRVRLRSTSVMMTESFIGQRAHHTHTGESHGDLGAPLLVAGGAEGAASAPKATEDVELSVMKPQRGYSADDGIIGRQTTVAMGARSRGPSVGSQATDDHTAGPESGISPPQRRSSRKLREGESPSLRQDSHASAKSDGSGPKEQSDDLNKV